MKERIAPDLPGRCRLRFDRRGPRLGVRAWLVECYATCGIVAAESPGAARWAAVRAAREAGYPADFADVRCVRSPRHDAWAATAPLGRCFTPDFAKGGDPS